MGDGRWKISDFGLQIAVKPDGGWKTDDGRWKMSKDAEA
jgi:hypothetical protein